MTDEQIDILEEAFRDAFGALPSNYGPRFLEAIAIQLGHGSLGGDLTIPDAIQSGADTIASALLKIANAITEKAE